MTGRRQGKGGVGGGARDKLAEKTSFEGFLSYGQKTLCGIGFMRLFFSLKKIISPIRSF